MSYGQGGHSRVRAGRILWAAVFVFLALPAAQALAWGPATHVKLASDLLENLHVLPAALAALLARCRRDYIFGNIAADVVLAKRLSRVKQFCHHWSTGFAILEDAQTDSGRAFAYGYLSHLAADTIAHGKFLPRQMTLTRTTVSFGHLYWEMRADASIGPHYWDELRNLLDSVFHEHRAILSAQLTDTFLPFSMNWRLFYRMNRFVTQRLLRAAPASPAPPAFPGRTHRTSHSLRGRRRPRARRHRVPQTRSPRARRALRRMSTSAPRESFQPASDLRSQRAGRPAPPPARETRPPSQSRPDFRVRPRGPAPFPLPSTFPYYP
jgi:hypothetical protein